MGVVWVYVVYIGGVLYGWVCCMDAMWVGGCFILHGWKLYAGGWDLSFILQNSK